MYQVAGAYHWRMNKTKLALSVSGVGHPLVMIVLVVLALSWSRDPAAAWRITGFVAVMGLIPTGWLIWRRWSRHPDAVQDASLPSTRPILFLTLLAVLLLSGCYFFLVEHSMFLVRGSAVTALMVAVAAVLNRWIKLSLHLAFAVYAGVILARVQVAYGLPVLLMVPFLAWARLVLGRHTLVEVIGGSALGFGAAVILTVFWYHG